MSKIKILPELLSNKIAAGEVVERPASVVKELIENAIDAQGTKIITEIEGGGKSLIRVADNGTGMSRDDALLSLERYATSKIFTDKDLFQIKTLGFRGEALPSIASVSHFNLITREKDASSGTQITVEGGKIKHVGEIGAPPGSMVEVKHLFFNTPARRKFLKTIHTEMSHIADTMSSIALNQPEILFRLLHNGKAIKNWPPSSDPMDRVVDVLGKDLSSSLNPITFQSADITITGWVSSPSIARSTAKGIYVYVNGRYVHDRIIQHGLFEGYQGRMMKGRYPIAVVFITVPFDRVDVNVHPTKHQIRFVEQEKVHDTMVKIVSETLRQKERSKWGSSKPISTKQAQVSETLFQFKTEEAKLPLNYENREKAPVALHMEEQRRLWETGTFSDMRLLGQLHNTYIVCEAQYALVLIDQHAAHERVLFEQLQNRSPVTKKTSQTLINPETIDLGFREADILIGLIPELNGLGLEIESFSGNTYVIKAVPSFLTGRDVKPLILEMVEKIAAVGYASVLQIKLDQCLEVVACHGAIRANQSLTHKQMAELLTQLDTCANPSHCPHGRPTWFQLTSKSLEKSFGRIG